MNQVSLFKVISAGVIWGQAIIGGYLPFVIHDRFNANVTSLLNMFAGGIFLASSFFHLLPDAQANKALRQAGCVASGKCFPLAYLSYATGFLMVLILEMFAHGLQRRFGVGKSDIHEHTPLIINTAFREVTTTNYGSNSERNQGGTHNHSYGPSRGNRENMARVAHSCDARKNVNGTLNRSSDVLSPTGNVCIDVEVTHAHIDGIKGANPVLAFVVFGALSFHSVMEGIGLGSSNTVMWDILIAILAHKALAAFALSLELQHHKVPPHRLIMTIGMFSIMSPLGIFVGSLVVDTKRETVISGIFTAMAGGTFLFVAVMEILPQELQNQKHLIAKCCALLGGFISMGLLSMWT